MINAILNTFSGKTPGVLPPPPSLPYSPRGAWAMDFGLNRYINSGYTGVWSNGFLFECDFRLDPLFNGTESWLFGFNSISSHALRFAQNSNNIELRMGGSVSGTNMLVFTWIRDNNWHRISVSYGGSPTPNASISIDGVSLGTMTYTSPGHNTGGQPITIGRRASGSYFYGSIRNVSYTENSILRFSYPLEEAVASQYCFDVGPSKLNGTIPLESGYSQVLTPASPAYVDNNGGYTIAGVDIPNIYYDSANTILIPTGVVVPADPATPNRVLAFSSVGVQADIINKP